MDRDEISAITHGDRPFHNPLDPARIDEAIDRLGLGPGDRVLDVGCGPGELLVRIAERTGAGGLGVDSSEIVIEQARRRAAARAPEAALEFMAGDADAAGRTRSRRPAASAPRTRSAAWSRRSSGWRRCAAHGPARRRLLAARARPRVPRRARRREPRRAADLRGPAGRRARAPSLEPVWLATSSRRDWEDYEWALIANGDAYARTHEDGAPVRDWIDRARARLLAPGGRDTIGFALIVLRRTSY